MAKPCSDDLRERAEKFGGHKTFALAPHPDLVKKLVAYAAQGRVARRPHLWSVSAKLMLSNALP
jgi:hypothetical protein